MASNSVFSELLRNCKLDGSNYTIWKRKLMFLLSGENIDYVTMTDEPNKPAQDATEEEKEVYREELKEWTKDNKKARIFILGSMTDSLAGEYEKETAACVIIRRLEEDFGEVSLIRVLSLVNKFLTTKMAENTSVGEHLNKLSVMSEELNNAGYPFQEEVQVMVALNSLPHSWEQFKISFCHSERTLNMRTLRHHLLMEEDRKATHGRERRSQHEELHMGEHRNSNKKPWNNYKKKGGDLRDKLNKRKDRDDQQRRPLHVDKDNDKDKYRCHGCGDYGHYGKECPKRRRTNEKKENSNQSKKNEGRRRDSSPDAAGLY